MNSEQIQAAIYRWACNRRFTAPYGVLQGEGKTRLGKPVRSVTFGYARTLDVSVDIYNRGFIIVRTSRHGSQTFRSYEEAMEFLNTL